MKTFEKFLIETPIKISFDDEPTVYSCFYHEENGKSYYHVNEEYLMIVDRLKIKEIEAWHAQIKKASKEDDEEE